MSASLLASAAIDCWSASLLGITAVKQDVSGDADRINFQIQQAFGETQSGPTQRRRLLKIGPASAHHIGHVPREALRPALKRE